MKKFLAEYLKVVSRIGVLKGSGLMIKKATSSKQELSVNLFDRQDTYIRKSTSDWMAFKQVFIWKEYDFPYNFEAETIIDAGANVGYGALWFANRFPKAKIISLEPETSNFEMLKKNTSSNSNITCLKAGLWNRSCTLKIADSSVENWSFRTVESDSPDNDSIKAYSIDDIMKEHGLTHIDILKMDVEGSEKVIFETGYETWLPKTRCLIIELHDNMQKGSSQTFFNVISKYDFSFDVLGENLFFFNNQLVQK